MNQTTNKRRVNTPDVVPFNMPFNAEAIKVYMNHELPDGVIVENTIVLREMGYIEPASQETPELHVGDGRFQLKFPDRAVA